MPADVLESRDAQCLLMGLDTEKIVLDLERTVLQMERPGNRCPSAEGADDSHFKPIFAVGWRCGKIARWIAVYRYESSARLQTMCNTAAHCIQLRAVARVVQKIGCDRKIVIPRSFDVLPIPNDIMDPQPLLRFADPSQPDHLFGQINAGGLGSAALADHPGVEAIPAGEVDNRLAGWIANQPHQGEGLDVGAPRLLLRATVLLRNRIIIRGHARKPKKWRSQTGRSSRDKRPSPILVLRSVNHAGLGFCSLGYSRGAFIQQSAWLVSPPMKRLSQ